MWKGLVVAALALAGASPDAKEPIRLEVGSLDASRLRPYVSEWQVVEIAADGTSTVRERSFDQLAKVRLGGRWAWRQYQYAVPAGGSFDGNADFRTFAPIDALERAADGGYRKLTYARDVVRLECRSSRCPPDLRDGTVHTRDVPTAAPTFDYWGGTYGLLLALVPLKVGAAYDIPVFHPARGLIRLRVDVEAKETIRAADGSAIAAYRLRTPLTGWVYHVIDRPPYWLRLEYSRPDGSRQITERPHVTVKRG
jgi:hypothetical protein